MTPPDIIQQLHRVGEALKIPELPLSFNKSLDNAYNKGIEAATKALLATVESMCKPVSGDGGDIPAFDGAVDELTLRSMLVEHFADSAPDEFEAADSALAVFKSYLHKRAAYNASTNRETSTPAMTAGAEGREDGRTAFEADCRTNDVHIGRHPQFPEQYRLYDTQLRWMGWQAAWNARTSSQPKAGQAVDERAFAEAWRNWVVNTDGNKIDRDAALKHAIQAYLSTLSPPAAQEAVPTDTVTIPRKIRADYIAKGVEFTLRYCEFENEEQGVSTGALSLGEIADLSPIATQEAVPEADILTIMTAASYWHDNPQGNGKGMELHKYRMEAALTALRQNFTVSIGRKP